MQQKKNHIYPGQVDNLARTYSSSVDLAEVYTSLTDTSTVVRKILQTTITVSKNLRSKLYLIQCTIAVDFKERWLDCCQCCLVQSERLDGGQSFA